MLLQVRFLALRNIKLLYPEITLTITSSENFTGLLKITFMVFLYKLNLALKLSDEDFERNNSR